MKYMKNNLLLLLIVFLITSCNQIPHDVQAVLDKSASNKEELEKVIKHYQSTGEKDKLKAAYFLIANMEGKYSEYYTYNQTIYDMFSKEKKHHARRDKFKKIVDSLKKVSVATPLIVHDIDVITAQYLIENIDLAFEAWKEPWACNYTFEEFCEYVLPYRIENEPLSDWRKTFYNKYRWVKDSVTDVTNTREVILYLNDLVGTNFWVEDYLELPYIPVTSLDTIKAGGCDHRYLLMVSVMRAMGIPSMIDHAPSQNNTYKAHSWTVYINSDHKYYPFDGGRPRRKLFAMDHLPNAFIDSMMIPLADGWGSNVFRHTYSLNRESLGSRVKDWSSIPRLFRTTGIKNVTDQYLFDQQSIEYTIPNDLELKDSLVYLSVFGYGEDIREADWSYVENNKVRFPHVGSNVVYLLSRYKGNKLKPFSYPILLSDSLTQTVLKPNFSKTRDVVLTRKSNVSLHMQGFANAMIGAVFEGSHTADFQAPVTLYQIEQAPRFLTEKEVANKDKFRYVRYFSPNNNIHVAEIQFISQKDNKDFTLKGK